MRLAELSESTGVTVTTLKYYLREGLLHPGAAISRTQAAYDQSHVERVRLVRALTEVGGLPLAKTKKILDAINDPDQDWLRVIRTAQLMLVDGDGSEMDTYGTEPPIGHGNGETGDGVSPDAPERSRAWRWLADRGWRVAPDDPFIADLDRAWDACDDAGLGLDEERMHRYADHVEGIAAIDVATVPPEPHAAVRQVIFGTILGDPVISALRRLAQQDAVRTATGH